MQGTEPYRHRKARELVPGQRVVRLSVELDGLFYEVGVTFVIDKCVYVAFLNVELEDTADDKKYEGCATQPPCDCTYCEA